MALLLATSAFALDPARALTSRASPIWTSETGLSPKTIDAIVQTRDSHLWIGTEEGLVFDGLRFDAHRRCAARATAAKIESGDRRDENRSPPQAGHT